MFSIMKWNKLVIILIAIFSSILALMIYFNISNKEENVENKFDIEEQQEWEVIELDEDMLKAIEQMLDVEPKVEEIDLENADITEIKEEVNENDAVYKNPASIYCEENWWIRKEVKNYDWSIIWICKINWETIEEWKYYNEQLQQWNKPRNIERKQWTEDNLDEFKEMCESEWWIYTEEWEKINCNIDWELYDY